MARKVNYLNNRDLLLEIHRSKTTYCEFKNNDDANYDNIVDNKADCFSADQIQQAKENKAAKQTRALVESYEGPLLKKSEIKRQVEILPKDLLSEDLVFRVMTFEHIPLAPGRKKTPKREADYHARLNFKPFKHYKFTDSTCTDLKEVGKSHCKDDEYSLTHGEMTNKLAKMLIMLVNRYSQKSNWRGYTYLDEMRGNALLQLSGMGLQFDEAKSDNPFAYLTASISNAFTRVLNTEKRNQNIRDDLLVEAGKNPSFTRQIEHEEKIRRMREDTLAEWNESANKSSRTPK